MNTILVVDDNRLFRESVVYTLEKNGYTCHEASDAESGMQAYEQGSFGLVISDFKMPGKNGIQFLETLRSVDESIPFLLITAYGDIETAVQAMRLGAFDFLEKTDSLISKLEVTVNRIFEYSKVTNENKQLRDALREKWDYIGTTDDMVHIKNLCEKVADSRSTVLITGASGTGKELIARSLHFQSPRANRPFIKVNCAALPEGLIESELFGHEKGSFTGAVRQKRGKFELASSGTLLLDEIGEMPLAMQSKLLRVLQESEITRVGSEQSIGIDVRIVATTNRDLYKEVQEGNFREDLFFRLNVFHIELPVLAQRKGDLLALVNHFIQKCNEHNGFSVELLEQSQLGALPAYDFPGNIRELENIVERAVVLTRSGTIDSSLLTPHKTMELSAKQDGLRAGMTISEAEKQLILKTLEFCGDNRTRASDMLGISIRTLRNKLHEYGMSKTADQLVSS